MLAFYHIVIEPDLDIYGIYLDFIMILLLFCMISIDEYVNMFFILLFTGHNGRDGLTEWLNLYEFEIRDK